MKMKLVYNFLLFLFISFSSVAQKKIVKFQSINFAAVVGGEDHSNSALQTINGIKFSNWFSGIGVAIDNYRYKTLPLFVDGRWYFGNEKRAFIYGDIGYNFPMKNKPGKEIYYYNTYNFSGGIYTDFGIGYEVSLNKYSSLAFSLGHSFKKLHNQVGIVMQCLVGPCPVDYSRYDYDFGRMILKAGLVF
jgi:hypothetical protein